MNDPGGKPRMIWHRVVIAVLLVYLFLPLAGTLLFSLATEWQRDVLPSGYTLRYYAATFSDPRFIQAIGRTLLVAVSTVAVTLTLMVPAIFILNVYFPKWERLLKISVLLPFAFPPVVSAIGLIKMFSSGPVAITGTAWILIGVYFILIQPFIYQSVSNSLQTIQAKSLIETAEILGANKGVAFLRVVLPNILPGTLVASLLSFSMIFGEFVMSQMLVGGSYETIQLYLYNQMKNAGQSASAVVVTYFMLIFIMSGLVLKIGNRKPKGYRAADAVKEELS